MKLEFKKVLNEIHDSKGAYLNQVEKINAEIKNSLSSNKFYTFVSKPEGFFIKNDSNIISTITVAYDTEAGSVNNFKMKATKLNNFTTFDAGNQSDWYSFERLELKKALEFFLNKIKAQFDFNDKNESLNEFYGPKLKNLFKSIKNKIQQNKVDKEQGSTGLNVFQAAGNAINKTFNTLQNNKDVKTLIKELSTEIISIIDSKEGFKNCTLTSNINKQDNELEIKIGYNYLFGVSFGNDGTNITNLIVKKVYTFLNPEGKDINKPWNEFDPILEKKLDTSINDVENKKPEETEDPNKTDDNTEKTDDKKETETTPKTEEPKDEKTEQTPDADQQGVEVAPSNATPEVSKETVAKAKQDKLIDEITPKGTPVGNELQGVKNFKAGDIVQGVDGKFMRISKHFKLENPVITLLNPSKIYRPTNNLIKALDSLGLKIMVKDGTADESLQEYLEPEE